MKPHLYLHCPVYLTAMQHICLSLCQPQMPINDQQCGILTNTRNKWFEC